MDGILQDIDLFFFVFTPIRFSDQAFKFLGIIDDPYLIIQ